MMKNELYCPQSATIESRTLVVLKLARDKIVPGAPKGSWADLN